MKPFITKPSEIRQSTEQAVQTLWRYLNGFKSEQLTEVSSPDIIFVFGCNDTRVASVAAQRALVHRQIPVLLCGGVGRLSKAVFQRSEAETFAEIVINAGVASSRIWLEKTSTNTGENIEFAKPILAKNNRIVQRPILVCKNVLRARVWATFESHFPNLPVQVCSLSTTFDGFCDTQVTATSLPTSSTNYRESAIHLMVGEIDRLRIYPQKGYSTDVSVPDSVIDSAEYLKQQGYTHHSLTNQ